MLESILEKVKNKEPTSHLTEAERWYILEKSSDLLHKTIKDEEALETVLSYKAQIEFEEVLKNEMEEVPLEEHLEEDKEDFLEEDKEENEEDDFGWDSDGFWDVDYDEDWLSDDYSW